MITTELTVTDRMTGRRFVCRGANVVNNGNERALRGTIARMSREIMGFLRGFGEANCDLADEVTGEILASLTVRANFGQLIY